MLLLFVVAFFYLWGVLGMGVLVSTMTQTQISAMLTAILLSMLPSILLSGFIFPIRQMPYALQVVTIVVPARYFIEILRDIYLKGLGLESFWQPLLYIILFGLAVMVMAVRAISRRLWIDHAETNFPDRSKGIHSDPQRLRDETHDPDGAIGPAADLRVRCRDGNS